jgi:multidrug efflux system outer membrane protein
MNKSALTLALAVTLAGCSLTPDYERPEPGLPERWVPAALQADTGKVASVPAAELGWQAFFRDDRLRQLIGIALENNHDLRIATLNVEAFRAQYRIQRADIFPGVSADAAMSRTHTPEAVNPLAAGTNTQYSATLGLSWELDLFGRVRSLRDQALEQYFASEAAQRSAKISLVSAVANAWLTLQADQALLKVAQDTLKTYEESLTLTQRSFDVGVASALELSQAKTAAESTRGALSAYTRLVAQDRNALAQLLGGSVPAQLLEASSLGDDLLAEVPAGLPSDLLQNRPDILQAEHQLRAANANIGAARAAFFPRIGLTGALGFASGELSDLFSSNADYWSFTPSISVPIFNAGRLRANRDYAEVAKNIQVAQYEKAIQVGFREVADGLAARATYSDQVQAQRNLLAASEEYYQLAERRYRGGVDSYLNLLVAQRQLFAARQQLVGDRLAQLISEVNLYKALGGGWLADEPQG